MNSERWQQIEEIFQNALDLSQGERARYLAEVCADDDALKTEVEKLLRQYEEAESFIEEPMYEQSGLHELGLLMEDEIDPMLGQRIGAYKIEREIGRGGMGAVYEAVRADGEFRHRVAIKVVKRGMDTDFILKRFRNERQILAALEHPNIAHLLSGGTTEDGRPYFVMEFIEGKPLYQFCDEHRLTIEQRLKLFSKICEAVQYAHDKLVIHRDLKPTNILVSPQGIPTLLDFGISKLLDPELASETAPHTATSVRMMTVEYASPEQVRGESVTFLSDVYSLGVLLYELLTGHRPYRFRSRMQHEIARAIIDDEIEHPSYAVNREEQSLPFSYVDRDAITISHLADARDETSESLSKKLEGNLDNITLKALRKKPEERYQSVSAFRQDIMRHLNGKPISAPFYFPAVINEPKIVVPEKQEEKSKPIAILPLKIMNLSGSSDRDESYLGIGLADAIITRLSNVKNFAIRPTSSVLRYKDENTDPIAVGRELAVDYVLDGRIKLAGERIRISLQLLEVINGATMWAGQFDESYTDFLELEDSISEKVADALLPQLTTQERQLLKKRGTSNPEAYEAYLRGRYFWNQFTSSSLPKAIESFQKAIALDPNYALPHVGVADFYNWSSIYGIMPPSECYPKAREAALRALELDDSLGEAYAALALIAEDFWEFEEAERLYKRALELSPHYPYTHEWYASLLVGTGRFDEGVKEMLRAEELDSLNLRTLTLVSWIHYQTRDYQRALDKAKQIVDLDHNFPQGHFQVGNTLPYLGQAEEAVEAMKRGIALMPDSALPIYQLCFALVAANRHEEAKEVVTELLKTTEARYVKPYFMAMCYVAIGEYDEALKWFEKSFEDRDPWLIWCGSEPKLDIMRKHTRFQQLCRRTKNPLIEKLFGVEREDTKSEKSVAVLPFKLTGERSADDTGDEYLCIGLADTLITRLSNVKRLIVRPTSSILRYERSNGNPFAAGRELDVNYIVDGNIRRIGDRIRVTVQLLNINEEATRWAGQFNENFIDVLQLEDSISQKVVESLLPHLTGEELTQLKKRGTDNPQAFELYLRGRYCWNKFTAEGFAKALDYYNRAIAIDPNYALAYTGIADYYNWIGVYGIMPFAESSLAAKEAAQKAIEFDPNSSEAHSALGFALVCHDFDWATAKEHLKHAIKINPNYATAHQWYGFHLMMEGFGEESIAEMHKAIELDPLSPACKQALAWSLYQTGRLDESIEVYKKLLSDEPFFSYGYITYSWTLRTAGLYKEAVAAAQKANELAGDGQFFLTGLASSYAAAGEKEKAREILQRLDEMSLTSYVSPFHLAMIHCHLGDKEGALTLLEKAYEVRDAWLVWLYVEPQFNSIKDEPRFRAILNKINHPAIS